MTYVRESVDHGRKTHQNNARPRRASPLRVAVWIRAPKWRPGTITCCRRRHSATASCICLLPQRSAANIAWAAGLRAAPRHGELYPRPLALRSRPPTLFVAIGTLCVVWRPSLSRWRRACAPQHPTVPLQTATPIRSPKSTLVTSHLPHPGLHLLRHGGPPKSSPLASGPIRTTQESSIRSETRTHHTGPRQESRHHGRIHEGRSTHSRPHG